MVKTDLNGRGTDLKEIAINTKTTQHVINIIHQNDLLTENTASALLAGIPLKDRFIPVLKEIFWITVRVLERLQKWQTYNYWPYNTNQSLQVT